jgi:hypothetical protein
MSHINTTISGNFNFLKIASGIFKCGKTIKGF